MGKSFLDEYQLEELRNILAKAHKSIFLKELYSSNFREIKNKNTNNLWNTLNFQFPTLETIYYLNPMVWNRLKIVNSWIQDNKRVLDIGFGSGILEKFINLKKRNLYLAGIDISEKSIIRAKNEFKNWDFKLGFADKIPYKKKNFDYIICLEVFEHISPSKIFKVLNEIKRVLKDNGKLLISVPLNENLKELIQQNKNFNEHVRIYTPSLIKEELKIGGFKILKTHKLTAFNKNYFLKTLINKIFFLKLRNANNIIILCQKI